MEDLGTLHRTNRSSSSAVRINADAEVVGYSHDPANVITRGFLYTDRDGMRDLGTLGGRHSWATDINDHGAVVGQAQLASGQQHAFLYTRRAGMIDLNALIDSTAGWTLWTAEAINNRGTIVGVGTMGGRSRGYRARRIRDESAPEIDASVSPQPNAVGWNTSDVTVRWSVRDPESGVESTSGCDTQTLTDNTAGLTFTCSAVNPFGGSSSGSVTVMIDKSAPEVEAVVSAPSNAAGWHTSDVTVSWIVRDPETGIASTSGCGSQTVAGETSGLTLTCAAVNGAGASSSRSVVVKIDRTAPVLSCAATPSTVWPPDGRMVPVSIAVDVADAFSGATGFTLQSISISDPAASQQAVAGFTVGTPSTAGSVQALRAGNGTARVYSFHYTSVDRAGLAGSCTASVVVPHDERQ